MTLLLRIASVLALVVSLLAALIAGRLFWEFNYGDQFFRNAYKISRNGRACGCAVTADPRARPWGTRRRLQ